MKEKTPDLLSFEEAYSRLEQILESMNSGKLSLEQSLKLYEEADLLISSCNSKLQEAEQKIEILVKNRNGDLSLDENGKPLTEVFSGSQPSSTYKE
ncbi:MAG: exodeoxyribonuclease VII small subunit [Chlamydiae bacterium]|jgi:exodeoxyribonuclease VII small subunit|nr:exodeoxyribonuclease VII small subunit [Chlamydiota bacterium]